MCPDVHVTSNVELRNNFRLLFKYCGIIGFSNKTKISVYKAAITSALLFGAETWTLYQSHFVRLRRVQQRHLRAILRVPYTDRITNDQILDRAGVPDIEMIVRKMQLRWAGHVR